MRRHLHRRSRNLSCVVLALALALASGLLPLASARADDRVPSPEAQWAASQAASGVSTDTFDAENLVYFVVYGGLTFSSAGDVVQHLPEGTSFTDDDTGGAMSGLGGFGLALIPPRLDWFAFEWHVEVGVAALDAKLRDGCDGCRSSDGAEPSLFQTQMGLTLRATVPVRYFSLQFGVGPVVTTFAQGYADPRTTTADPDAFTQWSLAPGLRLLAGIHFLVSANVRLFVDYRTDLYMDLIGQAPENPAPGEPPFRGMEIDGLRIHSAVAGIEFNTPGFQQMRAADKLWLSLAVPAGFAVLWGLSAVWATVYSPL